MNECFTSLASIASDLWTSKGWYISCYCQNKMWVFSWVKNKALIVQIMHLWLKSLPVGSSVLGFAPAQRHCDFHEPQSLFIWKCSRSKIHTIVQEEHIISMTFLFRKSNQLHTPSISVKYIWSVYGNECD